MPHDICTHWNATYDMLDFAYRYKQAINKITNICKMKHHEYEIKAHKWKVVQQLRDLLKVCCFIVYLFTLLIIAFNDALLDF